MLGSTFLYALDNTVVADVQAEIVRSLGGIEKLPWLGTAFVWATMSAILIWSRLYAAFDAKWLYLISSTIFEVGSAICGAAPNIDSMIVGRALAGLGASGMYMGCLTCKYFPNHLT
jgi:MFS family permease